MIGTLHVVSFMVRAEVGKEGYELGLEINDGRTIEEKKAYLSALQLYNEMLSMNNPSM